jgi:membrane protease YdiL (CAAX protease family)
MKKDPLLISSCPYCNSPVKSLLCTVCGSYLFNYTLSGMTRWKAVDVIITFFVSFGITFIVSLITIFSLILFFGLYFRYFPFIPIPFQGTPSSIPIKELINRPEFLIAISIAMIVVFLSFYLPLFLLTRSYAKKRKSSLKVMGLYKINFKLFIIGIGLGGLIFSSSTAYELFLQYLGIEATPQIPIPPGIDKETIKNLLIKLSPLLIILIGVLGPVVEEIYFRGFIYLLLRKYLKISSAMLLSALIFTIVHVSIVNFPAIFLAGFLLAYFYEKYLSLPLVMIAHGVNNTVAVILSILFL